MGPTSSMVCLCVWCPCVEQPMYILAASGIPVWASNVLIGLVCTFYTAVVSPVMCLQQRDIYSFSSRQTAADGRSIPLIRRVHIDVFARCLTDMDQGESLLSDFVISSVINGPLNLACQREISKLKPLP